MTRLQGSSTDSRRIRTHLYLLRAGIEISENIQISKNHVSGHKVPTLFKDLISFS